MIVFINESSNIDKNQLLLYIQQKDNENKKFKKIRFRHGEKVSEDESYRYDVIYDWINNHFKYITAFSPQTGRLLISDILYVFE